MSVLAFKKLASFTYYLSFCHPSYKKQNIIVAVNENSFSRSFNLHIYMSNILAKATQRFDVFFHGFSSHHIELMTKGIHNVLHSTIT